MGRQVKRGRPKKTKKTPEKKKEPLHTLDDDDLIHDMGKNTSPLPSTGDGEKKVRFASEFDCPHCGFKIKVEAGDIIKTPAVAAVKTPYLDVTRSTQTKLAT